MEKQTNHTYIIIISVSYRLELFFVDSNLSKKVLASKTFRVEEPS